MHIPGRRVLVAQAAQGMRKGGRARTNLAVLRNRGNAGVLQERPSFKVYAEANQIHQLGLEVDSWKHTLTRG